MSQKTLSQKLTFAFSLVLVAAIGVLAFAPREQAEAAPPPKALKYYPKDTSQAKLYKEMRVISAALGVKCAFCHVMTPRKQFAKDTKHKKIALSMLKLTDKINADILKALPKGSKPTKVTCYTCHRGEKHPASEDEEDDDE